VSARRPGDLRAWLAAVEARGALKHVSGADADFELGRIVEVNNSEAAPSALLFEDIRGYGSARLLASSPVELGKIPARQASMIPRDEVSVPGAYVACSGSRIPPSGPYHLLNTFPAVAASSRDDLEEVRRKWAALWKR
jgi:hypothetical protein